MTFLAYVNTPGLMPDVSDPFETTQQAWDWLVDYRTNEEGTSEPTDTRSILGMLARGNYEPAYGVEPDGTGVVYGHLPSDPSAPVAYGVDDVNSPYLTHTRTHPDILVSVEEAARLFGGINHIPTPRNEETA